MIFPPVFVPSGRAFFGVSRVLRTRLDPKRFYCQVYYGVNSYADRTHTCGELRSSDVGKNVKLCGWLEFQRMDRFAIIRDAYGSTQIIVPENRADLMKDVYDTPLESAVTVEGNVSERPTSQINKKMPTGDIEVVVSDYKVVGGVVKNLPFTVREYHKAKENLRLKYRYLDLRYPQMQKMLRLRSQLMMRMREFLINQRSFVEVETPTLFKRTPGGAQEFIVPTRYPGEFYSLVQSPQQLKQLLMVGGTDRYFQFARCYRDEGARPDRQPEFTQLDIELSFSNSEGVMNMIEELMVYAWPSDYPPLSIPFPKLTYNEAMQAYGTDQPDIRFGCKITSAENVLEGKLEDMDFPKRWENIVLKFIRLPQAAEHYKPPLRKRLETVKQEMFPEPRLTVLRGYDYFGDWEKEVLRTKLPIDAYEFREAFGFKDGDLVFLAVGPEEQVLQLLGKIRTEVTRALLDSGTKKGEWFDGEEFCPVWITEFPLFTVGEEPGSLTSTHHPFTRPDPEDVHLLRSDPLQVRGLHYDLVLNGCEIGGGSERIHEPHLQQEILENILRIPTKELSHLLEALGSGAPPHAGIALGFDRLVSLLVGAPSIREVIAFPKSGDGRDFLSGSPTQVSEEELKLYHIGVEEKLEEKSTSAV